MGAVKNALMEYLEERYPGHFETQDRVMRGLMQGKGKIVRKDFMKWLKKEKNESDRKEFFKEIKVF